MRSLCCMTLRISAALHGLDSYGWPQCARNARLSPPAALATLAKDGVCVSLGGSASHEVTCDIRQFRQTGRTMLYGFILFEELGLEPAAVGLAHLAGLIAAGKLKPAISVEAPWLD